MSRDWRVTPPPLAYRRQRSFVNEAAARAAAKALAAEIDMPIELAHLGSLHSPGTFRVWTIQPDGTEIERRW